MKKLLVGALAAASLFVATDLAQAPSAADAVASRSR